MLALHGDLRLDAPGGGYLQIQEASADSLTVYCSDDTTAWEGFSLLRAAYPGTFNLRLFRRLRNPLTQEIQLRVGGRNLLRWPPGKLPRIQSLRGLLRLLRG